MKTASKHVKVASRSTARFLRSRGWTERIDGTWSHPRCVFPWPAYDAERLEREQGEPLAKRAEPFVEREEVRGVA